MTPFLIIVIVLCLITIAVLWERSRDLTIERDRYLDNWGFWEGQCRAARKEVYALQCDAGETDRLLQESRAANKHLSERLSRESQILIDEMEKCCRYVEQLNATEAKLADANLRIEAAAENLTNQPIPGVVVEDEFSF